MHDPRTSPALRTLAQLTGDPPPTRWTWSIGRLDTAGRISLGPQPAELLGSGALQLRWHHLALLVEPAQHEDAATVLIDRRGRLLVPTWLRDRGPDVLIGLERSRPRILVGPVEVLDRFGDVLAGNLR